MNILFKILLSIWLTIWFFIGATILLSTPDQINKDQTFINTELKPSVEFVETYKRKNHTLPSKREFYSWEREHYAEYTIDINVTDTLLTGRILYVRSCDKLPKEADIDCKEIDWNKDYVISVWRGEWNEYYSSSTKSYIGNDYSYCKAFIDFAINLGVGLLPFLIWIVWKKIKNK